MFAGSWTSNRAQYKTKSGYWDITQKGGILLVFEIGILDITSLNWDIDLTEIGILGYVKCKTWGKS